MLRALTTVRLSPYCTEGFQLTDRGGCGGWGGGGGGGYMVGTIGHSVAQGLLYEVRIGGGE